MPPSIHGHDVLALLEDLQAQYTRATLLEAIHARFGEEARFHTCAAEGLTAAGLLEFLEARDKLVFDSAGALRRAPDSSCEH